VAHGQTVTGGRSHTFAELEAAARWVGSGPTIWISYGDELVLRDMRAVGLKPLVWTHIHVSAADREALEGLHIEGLVTVSDSARLPLLRSSHHRRVGRIYNPLAPVFTESVAAPPDRYQRRLVVYAGAAGPTKGLHRLLEMWRFAHRSDPQARLLIAGTGKLYGAARSLGPFGMSSPEFEARYVAPLAQEFGSLPAAGIELVGMLTPIELRDLYAASSLGVVNMNWSEYTETFCCAAVEMLATALPVFSVARPALPETIGRSGGAFLTGHEDPRYAAAEFNALLANPALLAQLGATGQRFVRTLYDWERILGDWERLIDRRPHIEALCGAWRGPRSAQYVLEYVAGRSHAPWLVTLAAAGTRLVRRTWSIGKH
jgi:glycosyltransferase involved in cell wall biosynthesis